ncbi:MAG: hypothetical protein K2H18_02825 [Muribaculaceae bacterium]|nr:hypothetical protein [Muribaculaceae bacterium]
MDPGFNPKITNLSNGYKLFNTIVFSPAGEDIIAYITSQKFLTYGDKKFQALMNQNGTIKGLIDTQNGNIWVSSDYPGIYARKTNGKQELMRIENNKIFRVWPLYQNIFVIEDPQYNLLGLQQGNKRILPFSCTDISWYPLIGKMDGKTVNVLKLEPVCNSYMLTDALKNSLNQSGATYLVNVKERGNSTLYNSKGARIAEGFEKLRVENDMLTFIENGETERMDLDGRRDIKGYDRTIPGKLWGLKEGYTPVIKNGKYGIYHEYLISEIIPPVYDKIEFKNDHFIVYTNGLTGMYDSYGKIVFKPEYKSIRPAYYNVPPEKNYFIVESTSGSKALFDKNGKVLVPYGTYDNYDFGFYVEHEKWCSVYKNGRLGILDLTTFKNTVPCLYEPGTEQTSNERWPNRKIALARKLPNGKIGIDVYRMTGGKIASKIFNDSADEVSFMQSFMERQLKVDLHILNW